MLEFLQIFFSQAVIQNTIVDFLAFLETGLTEKISVCVHTGTTRVQNKKEDYTVKRVDEVVRHPHLVTQNQFTQVSKKVSDIPEEYFTINIELFRQTFTNVELLRQS